MSGGTMGVIGASIQPEGGHRGVRGQGGALNLLDILVIGVLLGLLFAAAAREFPRYEAHTTPAAAVPDEAERPAGY
jgi:hypothetical protein